MLKVYGIHGRTTALIRIPAGKSGKAYLECEFARGRMGVGPANRPATFVTTDPVKQAIIEGSPLFGGVIKLVRSYEEEGESQPVKTKAAEDKVEVTAVAGVTCREEAVAYLKAHGAKATNLKDDESIRKYMAKIGVTFPNCEI